MTIQQKKKWGCLILLNILLCTGNMAASYTLFTQKQEAHFQQKDRELWEKFDHLAGITLFIEIEKDSDNKEAEFVKHVMQHLYISLDKLPKNIKETKPRTLFEKDDKGQIIHLISVYDALEHLLCFKAGGNKMIPHTPYNIPTNSSQSAISNRFSYDVAKNKGWKPAHLKALHNTISKNTKDNKTLAAMLNDSQIFKIKFEYLIQGEIDDVENSEMDNSDRTQFEALEDKLPDCTRDSINLALPAGMVIPSDDYKVVKVATVAGTALLIVGPVANKLFDDPEHEEMVEEEFNSRYLSDEDKTLFQTVSTRHDNNTSDTDFDQEEDEEEEEDEGDDVLII